MKESRQSASCIHVTKTCARIENHTSRSRMTVALRAKQDDCSHIPTGSVNKKSTLGRIYLFALIARLKTGSPHAWLGDENTSRTPSVRTPQFSDSYTRTPQNFPRGVLTKLVLCECVHEICSGLFVASRGKTVKLTTPPVRFKG